MALYCSYTSSKVSGICTSCVPTGSLSTDQPHAVSSATLSSLVFSFAPSAAPSALTAVSASAVFGSSAAAPTSTNPTATIFAWTGALRKRGELDNIPALSEFAGKLEKAVLKTMEDGIMTKDLVGLVDEGFQAKAVTSEDFIAAVRERLEQSL